MSSDAKTVEGVIKRESEKAWLLDVGGIEDWLPKSQVVEIDLYEDRIPCNCEVVMQMWVWEKKKWSQEPGE